MATLTGSTISSTYKDLLQVDNSNAGVDGTLRDVEDGEGTVSKLQISTVGVKSTGTLETTGDTTLGANLTLGGATVAGIKDEDAMTSDSPTHLATQQSIKAYVDAQTHLELGTTSSTALAGDTTTISSGQASAIVANTAKTGITSGQASAITANTAKVTNVSTDLSASADGTSLTVSSSDGTNATIPAATTSAWGAMTDEDKTKLDGVATAATANDTDANLKARANHTGTQAASTISDFDTEVANNTAVTANTAKTGITSGQASAITANTAKTGITSGQASAITANTAKTGITSGQASEITANTAKTSNATHSGEVTGATALTIADNVVDEANLKSDNSPTDDYVLTAKSSASGGLTWAASSGGGGSAPEGTAVLSTGETGATKFLREDGDGTCSWVVPSGSGDVAKVGTPLDNQVGVWTGDGTIEGTSSLVFDSTGLGIGTAAPQDALEVSSAGATVVRVAGGTSSSDPSIEFWDRQTSQIGGIQVKQTSGVAESLQLGTTNAAQLVIMASGNVGIGTSVPSALLHLSATTDPVVALTSTTHGQSFHIAVDTSVGSGSPPLVIGSGTTVGTNTRVAITPAGNVGIGTDSIDKSSSGKSTIVTLGGDASSGATIELVGDHGADNSLGEIRFINDRSTNADMTGAMITGRRAGANNNTGELRFYTTSASSAEQRMTIDSTGNVGIGGTPTTKLDVLLGDDGVVKYKSAAQTLFEFWKEGSTEEARMQLKFNGATKIHLRGNGDSYFNGGNVGIGHTPATMLDLAQGGVLTLRGDQNAIHFRDSSDNLDFLVGQRSDIVADNFVFHSYGGDWAFSSGLVGIGGTPSKTLHVLKSNEYAARIGGASFYWDMGQKTTDASPSLDAIGTGTSAIFRVNGTEHMRIKDSGRVTVKKSSNSEITALTSSSGSTAVDMDAANNFSLALAESTTLAQPTNITAGQSGAIVITQDVGGLNTMAYHAYWHFEGGVAPTLSTAGGSVDTLVYYVASATSIHAVLLKDMQ